MQKYFKQILSFTGNDGNITGKKAFIFSLTNLKGFSPFKMELKINKWDNAATQDSTRGPIFGDGDIAIGHFPYQASSTTNLGESYEVPSGITLSSDEKLRLLAGSDKFVVDYMEVFYYNGKTPAV